MVNSGGVVYFALFKENKECGMVSNEAAAVLKFTPSRLVTQSERLGFEIARQLGVCTPQSRIIHRESPEWGQIQDATQRCLATAKADNNGEREATCAEVLEALSLSHCLLFMGYINGCPLLESPCAFQSQEGSERTAAALGRVLVLDLVLRNEDRLCCCQLGWRGNSANLLLTEKSPIAPARCSMMGDCNFSFSFISGKASKSKNLLVLDERKAKSVNSLPALQTRESFSSGRSNLQDKEAVVQRKMETVVGGFEIVAIDSGVPRRPPAGKRLHDQFYYPKLVELLLNDSEFAANVLYEISGGNLGCPQLQETSTIGVLPFNCQNLNGSCIVSAFHGSFRDAIHDMQKLYTFLLKLYRSLDMLLRKFILAISKVLPNDDEGRGEANVELRYSPKQGKSQAQSPQVEEKPHFEQEKGKASMEQIDLLKNDSDSHRQELRTEHENGYSLKKTLCQGNLNWKCSGNSLLPPLSKRLTLKLKGVKKFAKVDVELNEELKRWNDILLTEGQILCQPRGFVTGFLEGGGNRSVVDSYELKVRLEHILERMALILNGADTDRPSCIMENLYIGGALAAHSLHTLRHIGITHILCLCPNELDSQGGEYMEDFEYKNIQVQDRDDADICCIFSDACEFIDIVETKGGKVLVHCFEGKSRSATIVLAYLMMRKNQTLLQAWDHLKAVHHRALPNDGFMQTLVTLDKQLHGKASMDWHQKKPVVQTCPVCGKSAGFSNCSLKKHLQRSHPRIGTS